ncbi:MAG: GntR family transcriptional regulator, partial [Acidimicrobiia bacterium]
MTVEWALGGPDILLTLDRSAGPIKTQIQDQLRAAIREKRVGAGERLPSTRRFAELLGVSRGTVVDVYEQLLAEGYVESAVGSGTRVAAMPAGWPAGQAGREIATPASPSSLKPAEVDFEYGIPDLGSVPL